LVQIVRMDEFGGSSADELFRRDAEEPFDGGSDVADDALRVEHVDHVPHVVEEELGERGRGFHGLRDWR